MKIIICASISAVKEVLEVKEKLEKLSYIVEIPERLKNEFFSGRTSVSVSEKAEDKIKYDVIKSYYKKIIESDAVFVVNPEKNGIKGYIGGNTLIEMAFGYVLGKKIYCLYPIPEISYTSEILAMKPIVLEGKLENLI
jgi:hypothetical protein